jgi:hypothetical protein
MTAPTAPVTVDLFDGEGNPIPDVTVNARLDKTDRYQGFIVAGTVSGVSNAAGRATLNLFPNHPTTGLGTTGSTWTVTANPPGHRALNETVQVPTGGGALSTLAALATVGGLTAAQAAVASATASAGAASASAIAADASADAAADSETAAGVSAAAAAASAITSEAAATSTSGSAATATAAAEAAGVSETNAAASAAAALLSEGAAGVQAGAALASAGVAIERASAAEASAATALGAVAPAEAAAVTATTQAGAAAASAVAAASSADAAATSAGDAEADAVATLASRNAAATSESNAAGSAGAAAASAVTAAAEAATATEQAGTATAGANTSTAQAVIAVAAAADASSSAGTATAKAGEAAASADAAAASEGAAATSETNAAASAVTAGNASSLALAIFGSAENLNEAQTIMLGYANTATAQANMAASSAASAASVLEQDLSAISAALHRSPNAITALFPYDTSKDSDGGAWVDRCGHTSWQNEALNGTWLPGGFGSEMDARDYHGTIGQTSVVTGDSSNFTSGVGGWSPYIAASAISSVNGRLRLTLTAALGNTAGASIPVTTVVGQRYRIDAILTPNSSGNSFISAGTAAGNSSLGNLNALTTPGSKTLSFVATGTTTYINVYGSTAWTQNSYAEFDDITVKPVSFATSPSGAYYQLATDGKFYRLWKNLLKNSNNLAGTGWTFTNASGAASQVGNVLTFGTSASDRINQFPGTSVSVGAPLAGSAQLSGTGTVRLVVLDGNGTGTVLQTIVLTATPTWYTGTMTPANAGASWGIAIMGNGTAATVTVGDTMLEYGTASTAASAQETKVADQTQTEVFRGNTRKFPRLAAIVAEAASVTIYDLTQSDRPMWRRFSALLAANWWASGATVTSIAAVGGILLVGASSSGVRLVDFVLDDLDIVNAATTGKPIGGVASSNSATSWMSRSGVPALVNSSVNAVAMTVLPDAPVDPATGLQVPTILVGTAGGMSQVQNDGTVCNSTSTGNFANVSITPQLLMGSVASSSAFFYATPPRSGATFALGSINATTPPAFATVAVPGHIQPARTTAIARQGARVALMRFNETTAAASLVAYVSDTSNTGFMTGDIRRCWLSDTVAGALAGAELAPAIHSSNWAVAGNDATHVVTFDDGAGTFRYQSDTISPFLSVAKAALLTVGKVYSVSVTVSSHTSGAIKTTSFNSSADISVGAGVGTITFTGTASSTSFGIVRTGTNVDITVSAISITEAVADRSYKAKHLPITGTLTRTAVATAAQLMFFSGWSATNYAQEPYSSDLDFGTAAWSVSAWGSVPATGYGPHNLLTESEFRNGVTDAPSRANVTGVAFSGLTGSTGLAFSTAGVAAYAYKSLALTVGAPYTLTAYVRMDDGLGPPVFGSASAGSASNDFAIVVAGGAQNPPTYTVADLGGGLYRVSATTASAAAGSSHGIVKYDSNSARTFTVSGYQLERGLVANTYRATTTTAYNGIAPIFERAAATGPYIKLGLDGAGMMAGEVYDGTSTRRVTSAAAYNNATALKARLEYATSGTLSLKVNGQPVASTTGAPLLTLNNASAVTTIGNSRALDAAFPGSIALVKASATVPTQEQSTFMYEQEKFLFQPSAQCCLPDSGAVVDLTYDPSQDKWCAASAANESCWTGLVRTLSTAVSAGSISKVSTRSGVKLLARTTTNPGVDVTIPAYGLREELVNRSEAAARLARAQRCFEYVGGFTATTVNGSAIMTSASGLSYASTAVGAVVTGSGIPANTFVTEVSGTTVYLSAACTASAAGVQISFTDFILPTGYEATEVMAAGLLKQEGATKDWTRLFDGFREKIRFAAAPGYTAWVHINARRSA